ncbi:MAG: hypothetical protein H0W40_08795 [Methylibium sp.]|uniref:hypothetical protein n=1 Tax=Methylibium sp. TaxID=2067992 RepID=UPI001858F5A6|nr:hypothetical protein [Methylibium sp.]MBA3597463.1 hypothetical protein [Methylibium sp.]
MQADYPASFERDTAGTEAEWLLRLSGACGACAVCVEGVGATVAIGTGRLFLSWSELPPRRIALMCMPRMTVGFRFEGVTDEVRQAFMRYFDLYMQRGGG